MNFTKTIIPLALIASESIAHTAFGLIGYWLIAHSIRARGIIANYTIIYKYGKRTCQLKIKGELNNFPQKTVAAGENRFALELNQMEVIELLETQHQENKESHKEWRENKVKTLFWQFKDLC